MLSAKRFVSNGCFNTSVGPLQLHCRRHYHHGRPLSTYAVRDGHSLIDLVGVRAYFMVPLQGWLNVCYPASVSAQVSISVPHICQVPRSFFLLSYPAASWSISLLPFVHSFHFEARLVRALHFSWLFILRFFGCGFLQFLFELCAREDLLHLAPLRLSYVCDESHHHQGAGHPKINKYVLVTSASTSPSAHGSIR